MKQILALLFLATVQISCSQNKKNSKEIKYWYEYHRQDKFFTSDTFQIGKIHQPDSQCTFLASKGFICKKEDYGISMFTNEPNAPMDRSEIYYELNNLGVIYSRNNVWQSYGVLKSNNDSVNYLISTAIENIMLHEEFRCFDLETKHTKDITFLIPTVKK